MTIRTIIFVVLSSCLLVACRQKEDNKQTEGENRDAKAMLQGVWIDSDTQEVNFKASGDTIYYPDSLSQPAYFNIVGDSLVLGDSHLSYAIVKHTDYLFWFRNTNNDIIKLQKSNDPDDAKVFEHQVPRVQTITEVVKRDTVVNYGGERYHCYVAINPTKYKVHRPTFNDDGVEVDNIYYDNIVHISVYKGAERIYSSDLRKFAFSRMVPSHFLSQAVLSNVVFSKVDSSGFHFDTTICIPDGASCYMVDTNVSFDGKVSMELLEY